MHCTNPRVTRSESQARLTFDLKDVPEFTASLLCWELPLGMPPWLPVPRKCMGGGLFEARMQRLERHSKTLLGPNSPPSRAGPGYSLVGTCLHLRRTNA